MLAKEARQAFHSLRLLIAAFAGGLGLVLVTIGLYQRSIDQSGMATNLWIGVGMIVFGGLLFALDHFTAGRRRVS